VRVTLVITEGDCVPESVACSHLNCDPMSVAVWTTEVATMLGACEDVTGLADTAFEGL